MPNPAEAPVIRPVLLDLIAQAEADPDSDEAHFIAQLRAAIAGLEGRSDPFHARYRSASPDRLGRFLTRYRD